MLKITIQVQENNKTDSCNVTIINPKDLSKASENEKNVGAIVRSEIEKVLTGIQNKK